MALTTNLLAYWKFDESSGSAADSSGNGHTISQNGAIGYVAGKINNGTGEGTSTKFFSSTDAALGPTGDFSVAGWFNPSVLPLNNNVLLIVAKDGNAGNRGFAFGYGDYTAGSRFLNFVLSSNGTAVSGFDTGAVALSIGTFYHVALTYKVSTGAYNVYLSGSNIFSGSSGYTTQNSSTADFVVAQGIGGYQGYVDELGIWTRELTAGDITQLYNGGAGLSYPFASAATGSNLAMMGV